MKTTTKKQNVVFPLLSSASMPFYPFFINPFHFCSVLFPFYATKALYKFQMMYAEGQTSGRFLDFLLCLLELPGVLRGSLSRV